MRQINTDSIEKIPPHDLSAEQAVLGCILLNNTIDRVRAILPDSLMFYSEAHRHIYNVMLKMADEQLTINEVLLDSRLDKEKCGGKAYLATLIELVPTPLVAEEYANVVREKHYLRQLMRAYYQAGEAVFERKPLVEVLSEGREIIERTIGDALGTLARERQIAFPESIKETYDDIENRIGKELEFPTGLSNLDERIGGLCSPKLITVGARTSMGKTAFALTVCRYGLKERGKEIIYVSLEMGASELIRRLLTMETGVDLSRFAIKNLSLDNLEKVNEASREIAKWKLTILDNLEDIAQIEALSGQIPCDLIIVDYIQLVAAREEETRALELGRLTYALKRLAKKRNIPILAISQLSRKAEGRRPVLGDLRESGGIEDNSDQVLLLYRPGVENSKNNPEDTKLYIAKNRDGMTGKVDLYFDLKRLRFFEMEERKEKYRCLV